MFHVILVDMYNGGREVLHLYQESEKDAKE
jgi:hypothetical protein